MVDYKVCAVLPAGGCGQRMGKSLPRAKQFCEILQRPVISYTLEAFERIPWIDAIIVTISLDQVDQMKDILEEFHHTRVHLTHSCSTRHRSIWNGVKHIEEVYTGECPDVVIIHDAVRPFVDEETMRQVANAANEHGASGAVRPLVSTVIAQDEDGFLDHALDRTRYKGSEMPQAFRYSIIKNAYEKCTEYDFEHGTECLRLAQEYAGARVRLVPGTEHLWKVTYKKDLYGAEGVIKESMTRVAMISNEKFDMETFISDKLHTMNIQIEKYSSLDKAPVGTNSMVYMYGVLSLDKIRDKTRRSLPSLPIGGSIVHIVRRVVDCCSDVGNIDHVFVEMKRMKEECAKAKTCVFLVIARGECYDEASDLISSLIRDRNPALSGQVFVY